MDLKSIRIKISAWAGVCLIVTATVIIGYSAVTVKKEAEAAKVNSIEQAQVYAEAVADKISGNIKSKVEVALDAARTLAQTLSGIVDEDNPIELGRDEVNSILGIILDRNPSFVGTYTCWEPNAFDGMDRGYSNKEGHDKSGRFIPYWNRNEKGEIVVEALMDYDLEGAGDYYQIPKKTLIEAIIDPYLYPVQGKPTLLTSLVVPITAGDKFYGIAGIDLRLDFFQELVNDTKDIYAGTARIQILSNNGTIVAATGKPELAGKNLKEVSEDFKAGLGIIQSGKISNKMDDNHLKIFVPMAVGHTTTPWSVNIEIPRNEITKIADRMVSNANSSIMKMIAISVTCAILALILLWFVASGIVRPIRAAVDMIKDISEGDGDLTSRLNVTTKDEMGHLSQYFNQFVQKLQTIIKDVADNAGQLNQSAGELTEISQQMSSGAEGTSIKANTVASASEEMRSSMNSVAAAMEEASTNVNMVASATEEMTATINEIAQNTEKARSITSQAVNQASNASTQVGELGQAAKEIGKVVETITDISEQVNLLALNATIEAARAGDAGKGFAVVANEIKELAKQTAEATGEITTQVGSIQASTDGTVSEIEGISKVANEVNEIVSTIATAVEEQSVTTKEIAENVMQASGGIAEVNKNVSDSSSVSGEIATQISDVNLSVGEMSNSGSQVDLSAEAISKMAGQLNELVGKFRV
jgi:methyl-accepting chemotaxis protein